ncbi:MAG: PKD domain-containing protein [Bacteroidia bacterium]
MRAITFKPNIKLLFLCLLYLVVQPQHIFAVTADFSVTPTSGCSPLIVSFKNLSSGAATYLWRLGNGNNSTLKDPGAIYSIPGTYTVTLIAKDASGNVDSIVKKDIITVFANPVANFKVDVSKGCAPLTVAFTDLSKKGSHDIISWLWDFGDGNTSTNQHPKNTYTLTGNFDVTLIVKDKNGCSHTITKAKTIIVPPKPKVSFTVSDSVACEAPLNITFTAQATSGIGGPLKYLWDFGDGTTSTKQNPQYKYTNKGSYSISLTVTDTANCSATYKKAFFINIGREKPDFSFTPNTGCAPLNVSFTNLTTPANAGTTYSWKFGDGNTSTSTNPVNNFSNSGAYTITLYAKNAAGCIDSIKKTITLLTSPVAKFTASDSIACHTNFYVEFKNTTGSGTVVSWDFGDGSDTSGIDNIGHYYKDTGKFTVTLVVKGANGCRTALTKTHLIRISLPNDSFAAGPKEGCIPLKVNFKNYTTSPLPITSWKWDFGDGTTSTDKDPGSHTYTKEGKYTAKLIIGNAKGCYDSFAVNIKAGSKPTANFTATPLKGCINDMRTVKFTNLSLNADSFFWDFDAAGTSTKKDPIMPYDIKEGKYPVTLTVWNKGCKDSLTKKDYIEILPPWANFTAKQVDCQPDSITFTDASVGGDSIIYYFGDGDTSTKRNPLHVFKKPGTYNVLQIAYNRTTKCIDSFQFKVVVDPLMVDFEAQNTSGCAPLTVEFLSTVNKVARWEWDFGDGSKSTETDPRHTFTKKGTFDVTLKITSQIDSCVKIVTKKKLVNTFGPEAKFGLQNEKGCVPLKVKLIDSSTSAKKILKKEWDLGNGITLPVTSPIMEYTYTTPPTDQTAGYTITLNITDSAGCKASVSKTAYPTHPKPNFYLEQEEFCGYVNYKFVPSIDGSVGLGPFKYFWDLGDKDTTSQQSPTKAFFKSGIYAVKLVLTDVNGCKDSIVKKYNPEIKFPEAKMSAEPSKANCPPLLVKFKDESTTGMTGIQKWYWDFGDGTYSELRNPEKIYLHPGDFTVKLIITDSVGCKDTVIGPDLVSIKGPTGTLEIVNDSGCVPLTVTIKVVSKNAISYTYDMGDGTIIPASDKSEITYTYTYASSFIPSVTLMDSFGCRFHLPPVDTIVVHPLPVSAFSSGNYCFGYPTVFEDASDPKHGKMAKWLWEFGDGDTSTLQNPKHIYAIHGLYPVSLTVTNSKGCQAKSTQNIRIYGVDAQCDINEKTGCIGKPLMFSDKSVSDTNIIAWQWDFGDSSFSDLQHPQHTYLKKAFYNVKLTVTDATGCTDTLTLPNLLVGDTAPPPALRIYRVTVENNNTIELDFEKYDEIDFYGYVIYRKVQGGNFTAIDTVYNANDTVYYDNAVNALYNVYCYKIRILNICGGISGNINNEHCTIELKASPALNAAVLKWNFYYGWNKVKSYEIYREDVNNKNSFLLLATVDGNTNTYIDSAIVCYQTHAYRIKAYEDSGFSQVSWSDTSITTPKYIAKVPPAFVVRATVENDTFTRIEWTGVPQIRVKHYILEKSDNGMNYSMLDTPFGPATFFTEDKDVNVHERSYYYRILVIDSCGDISPYSNLGKTILLKVDTTSELEPRLRWSAYRDWPEGVQYYDIERKQEDGSFLKIAQTQTGNDTSFVDNITDLNSLPVYCYRIIAYRNGPASEPNRNLHITSMSNIACVPVRSVLWIPNVFTPNQDSMNEKFLVTARYIKKFEMKIFDRWGARVFETNDINDGWDGSFRNEHPLMDAYKYIIVAQGVDGKNYYRQGWVTVLP